MERGGKIKNTIQVVLILICAGVVVPQMPVNYFTAAGKDGVLFSCPVPNGYSFSTTYIHSLELTPVIDEYRFVSGRIWGWEERTLSLKAGMPSVPLSGTKLIVTPQWMITRGGRRTRDIINYRIGTGEFGRNKWLLEPWEEINIFEKYPKHRVSLQSSPEPFRSAAIIGFDSIQK